MECPNHRKKLSKIDKVKDKLCDICARPASLQCESGDFKQCSECRICNQRHNMLKIVELKQSPNTAFIMIINATAARKPDKSMTMAFGIAIYATMDFVQNARFELRVIQLCLESLKSYDLNALSIVHNYLLGQIWSLNTEIQSLLFFIQLQLTNINPMKLKIQLDIHIINNQKVFQPELTYDTLIGALVFGRDQSISDAQQLTKAISAELFNFQFKSIYVGLKWLIFFHQCLNLVKTSDNQTLIAKQILDFLGQIKNPKTLSKHEEYLFNKLFVPYLQYLIKLASVVQIIFQNHSSPQNYIFLEFNLLRFAIAEFTHPICEFNPFFKKCYPHLSKCFTLISKQLYGLYKKVALHYQLKQLSQMHFIEVQQLSQSVVFFYKQKEKNHKNNSNLPTHDASKQNLSPFTQKTIAEFMGLECTQLTLNS